MNKKCTYCKQIKTLTEFYKNTHFNDGHHSHCKECCKERRKEYSRRNKLKISKMKRIYYLKNKTVISERKKLYTQMNYTKIKNWRSTCRWRFSYYDAKRRCINPKRKMYHRYGGRNIKFLITLNDFKSLWFRDKAYLMERPSIDRIDNDGHYEKNNCRFIEWRENTIKGNRDRVKHKPKYQLINHIEFVSDFILLGEYAKIKIVN